MLHELVVRRNDVGVRVVLPDWAIATLRHGLAPDTSIETAQREDAAHGEVVVGVAPRERWTITCDRELSWSGTDRVQLARRLCSEVHLAIAAHSPVNVFIHAGAIGWRGGAVLLPGRSMAGKTTLVQALLEQGAGYLSDEYAVIDPDGMAHPYAKPLTVRTPLGRVVSERPRQVITSPLPVVAIVHTWFERYASWTPTVRTGAQVVLPLIDNAVAARLDPERVLDHTSAVACTGVVSFAGVRGDAHDTAASILDAVDRTIAAANVG